MTSKEERKQSADYHFTLIHGTFAADADWVGQERRKASPFRVRLREALKGKVISFHVPPAWGSLGNLFARFTHDLTNTARLQGAEKLKQYILNVRQSPGQKHFLVAHSHGGNIALYALKDPKVRARVDGLICMATPFLFPRLRPLNIAALMFALLVITVVLFVPGDGIDILPRIDSLWGFLMFTLVFVFTVLVPAILICVVAGVRYGDLFGGRAHLETHIERLDYSDVSIPVLLVRSSGDEASGLLRGTQFFNWGGGVLISLGARYLGAALLYGAIVLGLYLLLGWELATQPEAGDTYHFIIGILAKLFGWLLVAVAAVLLIMLVTITASRLFVGLDAWRWVGELETMVEDGPPGIDADLVVVPPSTNRKRSSGLAHSEVYLRKETARSIAAWCKKIGALGRPNRPSSSSKSRKTRH